MRKSKITANKDYRNPFPAKIYSRVNILSVNSLHKNTVLRNRICSITTCLICSETKRYTMKYWFIVWKDVFLSHLLNKKENIINLVTGYSLYFLKISKINAQQEKPICPNRKNWVPQNTKNGQSAKINSHKNFVPHGILLSLWLRPLKHMNDGRNKRALLELDSIFFSNSPVSSEWPPGFQSCSLRNFFVIYSFSFFDHQNWDVQEIHLPLRMLGENYRCPSMMTMMSR